MEVSETVKPVECFIKLPQLLPLAGGLCLMADASSPMVQERWQR